MQEVIKASSTLDELTAQIKMKLVENHILTNNLYQSLNRNSIEIGQWLTQAKTLVKHGEFSAWLADNFNMTDRTARNYMKVAAYFGESSTFKTENVFRFQPAALLELTKIPVADVQKFLDSQIAAGVDPSKLSVRNLRENIKNFLPTKTTIQEKVPVTIDVEPNNQLQLFDLPKLPALPAPKWLIPPALIETATRADLSIQIDFRRNAKVPVNGVLITKTAQIFKLTADVLIFCPPLLFTRSDGTANRFKFCLWYFGDNSEKFIKYFKSFGVCLFQK